jgi:class 3 adenylate cyclase
MEGTRKATVLFADVNESTKLYETACDAAAHEAIQRAIETMRRATESTGGRVVKTIGDEVLALFPGPDAAAAAASEMHALADLLPIVSGSKLALRIGFHCGPVLQREDDVFGDTVNLAARLAAQAERGQILLSAETAAQLSPALKRHARDLYSIPIRGRSSEVALCEFIWRTDDPEATVFGPPKARARTPVKLRLRYRGKELVRRRENDSIDLGRDPECGLAIAEPEASRRHCTIERRQDTFVLRDHSTNGTYVTLEGDGELLLQRETITLRKHGWIAVGKSRAESPNAVEFFVD